MDPALFLLALGASLVSAFVAYLLYQLFYENRGTGSQVHRAFPLLSISITTLFIGVQLSLPLSLGLLGALSIIRFRTPVKEPEEVGFIMLVIAASISCATFNFQFLLVLYLFAVAALLLLRGARLTGFLREDGLLLVTLPDSAVAEKSPALLELVRAQSSSCRLESTASRGDGRTALQFAFRGLRPEAPALQASIRALLPDSSVNIVVSRPGGLR